MDKILTPDVAIFIILGLVVALIYSCHQWAKYEKLCKKLEKDIYRLHKFYKNEIASIQDKLKKAGELRKEIAGVKLPGGG